MSYLYNDNLLSPDSDQNIIINQDILIPSNWSRHII